MKNTSYILCLLLYFFSVVTSCSQKKDEQRKEEKRKVLKECRALNDVAIEKLNSYYYQGNEADKLDSALVLLQRAVECDTNYFLAYANMATVLTLKGNYNSAIEVVNKLLTLTNNDPEIVVYKGMLYEKQGKRDIAKKQYTFANELYDKRIAQYPDSVEIIADKMILKAYLEGKEKALAELDRYIQKYPNSLVLQQYKEILSKFDREDFIGSIGPIRQ